MRISNAQMTACQHGLILNMSISPKYLPNVSKSPNTPTEHNISTNGRMDHLWPSCALMPPKFALSVAKTTLKNDPSSSAGESKLAEKGTQKCPRA